MLPIRMLVQGYGSSHRSRRMAPPQEEWTMGCWLACDSRHLILFSCSLSPPTYLAIKSTLESRARHRCDTSMARHKGEPACPNCLLTASVCCCLCCATLILIWIWVLSIDTEHFCVLPETEVLPLLGSVQEQPYHPASSGDGSSDLREDEDRVPFIKIPNYGVYVPSLPPHPPPRARG